MLTLIAIFLLTVLAGIYFSVVKSRYGNPLLGPSSHKNVLSEAQLGKQRAYEDGHQIFKNIICHNQSAYAEYHYLLSETHRRLKHDHLRKHKTTQELQDLTLDFLIAANRSLERNILANFAQLGKHFTASGRSVPRVCVKFNFGDIDKHLAPFLRDTTESYHAEYGVNESTPFEHVVRSGNWYLENNVPLAVLRGDFKNPRIIRDRVIDQFKNREKLNSSSWESCWKDGGTRASYYKSTLVVPITFRNNSFSPEFIRLVDAKIPDFQRTLFGFLCLDSIETGYFNEESDVSAAYAVADFISLYIFERMLYVNYSQTFDSIMNSSRVPITEVELDYDAVMHALSSSSGNTQNPALAPLVPFIWDRENLKMEV
jgi:hypothetical protein